MNFMKTVSVSLILFTLSIGIFSCKKNNDIAQEAELPSNDVFEEVLRPYAPKAGPDVNTLTNQELDLFTENIVDIQGILRNTVSLVLVESFFHPEIFGLAPNGSAEVRTCNPSTFINNVLTISFGTNCMIAGNSYTGTITATFDGNPATETDAEFELEFSNDFEINGYAISTSSPMEFENIPPLGSLRFRLDDDVTVTCMKDGITTTLQLNENGFRFRPIADGDDETNPFDPITYINNRYRIVLDPTLITCTSPSTTTQFIGVVPGLFPLIYQPTTCGCFLEGRLGLIQSNGIIRVVDFGNGNCNNQATLLTLGQGGPMPITLNYCN